MTRVLYIDDEKSLLTLTQLYLKEEADLDVEIATSAEEGLDLLKNSVYDAIISDYDMPDLDGIDFLKLVRTYDLTIPFIIFTGKGREDVITSYSIHYTKLYDRSLSCMVICYWLRVLCNYFPYHPRNLIASGLGKTKPFDNRCGHLRFLTILYLIENCPKDLYSALICDSVCFQEINEFFVV